MSGNSALAWLLLGAGAILIYSAYKQKSPTAVVTGVL